jgi:uncharacterized membrane protein
MSFTSLLAHVARVFEGIGAGVLVIGLIWSVVLATRTWRVAGGRRGYQVLREAIGAVLLLGLEILVAADLITTVAVAPTVRNVAVLGLIVLIRTFLSVSLQVEIDGRLPWRRFTATGALRANGVGNARNGPVQSCEPDEASR